MSTTAKIFPIPVINTKAEPVWDYLNFGCVKVIEQIFIYGGQTNKGKYVVEGQTFVCCVGGGASELPTRVHPYLLEPLHMQNWSKRCINLHTLCVHTLLDCHRGHFVLAKKQDIIKLIGDTSKQGALPRPWPWDHWHSESVSPACHLVLKRIHAPAWAHLISMNIKKVTRSFVFWLLQGDSRCIKGASQKLLPRSNP